MDTLIKEIMINISLQGLTKDNIFRLNSILNTIIEDKYICIESMLLIMFLSSYKLDGIILIQSDLIKNLALTNFIGSDWIHGNEINKYQLNTVLKNINSVSENITIYDDGYVKREVIESIQNPNEDSSDWILNDYGKLALK